MSAEVLASLQSLEQLEERVSSILMDESAKVRMRFLFQGDSFNTSLTENVVRGVYLPVCVCVQAPGSIVLDLSNVRDVGVSTVRNSSMDTLNAEQVTFIKRRTEPRLNQPSQVSIGMFGMYLVIG